MFEVTGTSIPPGWRWSSNEHTLLQRRRKCLGDSAPSALWLKTYLHHLGEEPEIPGCWSWSVALKTLQEQLALFPSSIGNAWVKQKTGEWKLCLSTLFVNYLLPVSSFIFAKCYFENKDNEAETSAKLPFPSTCPSSTHTHTRGTWAQGNLPFCLNRFTNEGKSASGLSCFSDPSSGR